MQAKPTFKQLVDEAITKMSRGSVAQASRLICEALLHADAAVKKNDAHLRRLEVAASLADNLKP